MGAIARLWDRWRCRLGLHPWEFEDREHIVPGPMGDAQVVHDVVSRCAKPECPHHHWLVVDRQYQPW